MSSLKSEFEAWRTEVRYVKELWGNMHGILGLAIVQVFGEVTGLANYGVDRFITGRSAEDIKNKGH